LPRNVVFKKSVSQRIGLIAEAQMIASYLKKDFDVKRSFAKWPDAQKTTGIGKTNRSSKMK
jgi:hypothetical protein